MTAKPEALRLAEEWQAKTDKEVSRRNSAYDHYGMGNTPETVDPLGAKMSAELRRLHAENERLAALAGAQQPAPSAAAGVTITEAMLDAATKALVLMEEGTDTGALTSGEADYMRSIARATVEAAIAAAPQPSPTPQADSAPAEAVQRIVHLRTDRERRVYVAGPMTGLPEYNFPLFNATAARLRSEGWHVENPAEHGHVDGAGWSDYLRWDISRIATCGAIYLLPGWSKSKGATLEVHVAGVLGLQVLLADGAEAPQADSQPAADEATAMNRTRDLAEAGRWPSDWVEAYRRGYSDRAARAPADSVTAPQGETNVQLDTDSNHSAPGQQRDVAGPVALGQPMGGGPDRAAGHLSAQGDKLLTVAERNIRSFLRSAVFKSESDREAALSCVDVLWAAARAPADSVTAPAGPIKPLPYEPTSTMLIAARERDPALPIETVRAIYWSMWRTAPTPPAQAQAGAPPLTADQREALWESHGPTRVKWGHWEWHQQGIEDAERHHGIKGGQHGAE